jgi:hypothetical protein
VVRSQTTRRDRRAGEWSRRQARELHLQFLSERWPLLAASVGLFAAATGVVAVVVPDGLSPYVIGFGAASACWYLALMAVQVAGTTSYLLGSQGEEWTSEGLRKLRRRGWHVIEHVPLKHGDIDHVLLGPGGAFAIETKATTRTWNLDEPDRWLLQAIAQCNDRAEQLRHLLRSGSNGLRTAPTPVLVLWGNMTGRRDHLDGVTIVHGSELRAWTKQLGSHVLSTIDVEHAAEGLWNFVDMRDGYISTRSRGPLLVEVGPFALASKVSQGLVGALGLLLLLGLASPIAGGYVFIGTLAGTALVGAAALRVPLLRPAAIGWLATSFGLIVVLIALVAADAIL